MFGSKTLKAALTGTTALIGVAMLAMPSPAAASTVTISADQAGTETLTAGTALIVNSGVHVATTASIGVQLTGSITATSIVNNGTIEGTHTGIYIETGNISGGIDNKGTISVANLGPAIVVSESSFSGAITNELGATISGTGIGIESTFNSNITALISNAGTIDMTGANGVGIVATAGGTISGGITNTGGISGQFAGIAAEDDGVISGAITNAAAKTIHGGTAGIVVQSGGLISGLIDNSGTISGDKYGIWVHSGGTIGGGVVNSTGIKNEATGLITGQTAGIQVTDTGSKITGPIVNAGTISGTEAAGIDVANSGIISGEIENTGTITGLSYGIHLQSGGTISGGIHNDVTVVNNVVTATGNINGEEEGIYVDGSDISGAGIVNTGTIAATSFGDGISVVNGGDISGGVHNNVTTGTDNAVLATGTISGQVAGIFVGGAGSNISGGIDNYGHIEGGQSGIEASNQANIASIVNEIGGTISGDGNTGIAVSNKSAVGYVTNFGSISGDTFGIRADTSSSIAGGIANLDNATIQGSDTGILVQGKSVTGEIENWGTISGNDGIVVEGAGSEVNDEIFNGVHGQINGGYYGILVQSGASVAGDIFNEGHINGSSIGVYVTGAASQINGITNYLTDATISGGAYGIEVANHGTIANTVYNDNAVILGGDTGIRIASHGVIGAIFNTGHITGENGDGIRVDSTSSISGGVTNQVGGVISGTNEGIEVSGKSSINNNLENDGTISGESDGILVSGTSHLFGGITNSGTISGGDEGIEVSSNSNINSPGITNNVHGVIKGGSTGIDVHNGGDISGGIDNFGTISGGSATTPGVGIVVSAASITGGIHNEAGGIIEGLDGGKAIFVNSGIAAITIDGGKIIGDVVDSDPSAGFSSVTIGGDFATGGNFTVSSLGFSGNHVLTISGANAINVQTFAPTTGTLSFQVLSNTQIGHINVATGAADLTAATLTASVASNSTLSKSTQLLIVHDTDGTVITGAPANGTLLADNSYIWDFKIVDGSTAATPTTDADLFLQTVLAHPVLGTDNENNVFDVLQGLSSTTNPQLQQILSSLNNAGSQQQVDDIVQSVLPEINGSDIVASQTVSDSTDTFTGDRLASLRTGDDAASGMAAGNTPHGVGAWGEVFGQHSDQSDRDGTPGFTANTFGAALGLDTTNLSDKAIVGLGFSYGHTNANSNSVDNTDTRVDNYELSLYGSYNFDRNTYLTGMAGYTWGNVDNDRHNVGGTGLTAHGNYDTQQISAQAEVGRDYAVQGGMTVTPNLVADWVNFNPDSYRETGAGGADLNVDGKTLNKYELGAGVKLGWDFKNSDGSWIKPQLRAGYRYDLSSDRIEDTAQFTGGGGAFSVQGPDPARSSVDLGASVKFLTTRNWTFTGSYDFDWKSDYTASAGFIRAGYKF